MDGKWSSRVMFILSAIGSAVGLGNIWRFSYMAGEYGGGAFIILYVLSVIFIGIPFMIMEFCAGGHFAAPISQVFRKIGGAAQHFSLLAHGLNLLILSYYVVVTGWTLAYLVASVSGTYFPLGLFSQQPPFALFTPITLCAVFIIMRTPLRDGIEKANRVLMPLFFAILLVMLAYSLTLPGFGKALAFYTHFGEINARVLAAAITQTLFSLSIGVGIMMTYAAHLKKNEKVASSAGIVAVADTLVALLAGLAVFPIVFTYGFSPAGGPALAFDTLPLAFAQMPFGNILMPLFFLLLFSVALTSIISMAEVMVAEGTEKNGRKNAALHACILIAIASVPSLLSYSPLNLQISGIPVLDYLDGTVVVIASPVVALLMVLILGWGWKDFDKESAKVLPKAILRPYLALVRYFIPAALAFALGVLFLAHA
jgi:neurotransmitter:Na+ symporter, NSS family